MAGTGDGFGTTTEEMTRAATHVDAVNESVRAELAGLRGKLEPLAGTLWTGPASVVFAQLMQRWDADAQQLNEALRSIGGALQGSGGRYEARERDESQTMSGIASALG